MIYCSYHANKAKYELPIPKPGKRIRQTSTEMILEVVEVKEVKSDDSNLTLSDAGGAQPGGSLLFNDANVCHHILYTDSDIYQHFSNLRQRSINVIYS